MKLQPKKKKKKKGRKDRVEDYRVLLTQNCSFLVIECLVRFEGAKFLN